jgi:hypothetical protein
VVRCQWLIPFRVRDLISALRFGSDAQKWERGEAHQRGGVPARAHSGSSAATTPVISGEGESTDEVQQGTARSKVWSATMIVSCRGAEGRPEAAWRRGASGDGVNADSLQKKSSPTTSEDAPERERERGTTGRARGCSTALESAMYCGGVCGSGKEILRPGSGF